MNNSSRRNWLIIFLFFCFGFVSFSGPKNDIETLTTALNAALKKKNHEQSALYSFDLANLYLEEHKPEKALHYFDQAAIFARKANNNKLEYVAYQQLGLLATQTKDFTKATDHYQRALKSARELQNQNYITETLILTGESLGKSEKWKRAIPLIEEALSIALKENDLTRQQKCYSILANYYEALGDKGKLKEYQNLYKNLAESKQNELKNHLQLRQNAQMLRLAKDSLMSTKYSLEATSSSLQEAKALNEKREMEFVLLQKDKQLAEMQIKEQNARLTYESWIRYSVFAGLFLSAAFIVVVVKANRKAVEANKKIEKQNNSIKSSINYAQRIQAAMLPKEEQQKNLIPESFVLFKPRDVVSGDFYWLTEIKNWYDPDVVFAAADCTGHGVPGAFMSMVGINALNNIIERGIADSDQILEALDTEIRNTLQQESSGNSDGMDISLGIYRKEKNTLEFSGAKNPLVYIQNKELYQIKGDARSIGGKKGKKSNPFTKHLVLIDQPTTFYLFTDGYRDQFGNQDKGKFLTKRFNQLLLDIHELSLQEQKNILENTLKEWRGDTHQIDDVLVLGVRLEPNS